MKTIKFGIIGCGLMGKEFAGAVGRWYHLEDECARPEIIALCDTNESSLKWFKDKISTVKYTYTDYHELLKNEEIDAIYCAVPHVLHGQIYVDIIESGKHFMGEKPFGMDKEQNDKIMDAVRRHPESVVRCAGEFPFYPACQMMIDYIKSGKTGRILEVKAGFCHSSDMNTQKPINWKRMIDINGEYGCMGDLGLHAEHIPFRMGWIPENVCAKLSNYVTERPDGKGGMAKCETWDNAILMCDTKDADGNKFPITFEMKRMQPGATNDWYLEIYGMEMSLKFSTSDPNAFYYTQAVGSEQAWSRLVVGNKPQFKTATGSIFEFGFTDAILQMWAAFIYEIEGREVSFGCCTPEETILSHKLHTAALESEKKQTIVKL